MRNQWMDKLNKKLMAFKDIFKDSNDINEKSVVGFISFIVMIVAMIVDLVTGWLGKPLVINEFIFNGFLWITIGSFGIAGLEKVLKPKQKVEEETEETN